MLSTISLVVASLSTGNKIGLTAVGVAFILFALVVSLVVPRRSPNFPGKGLPWFVVLCVLFFLAMISAVLVFDREPKEASASANEAATSTQSAPLPAQGATTTTSAAAPAGDPAAGRQVFASAGCSGCHTLKAAGATGTVGPNLDQLKPDAARVARQVTNGGAVMPSFKGKLSAKQIQDVAAYVASATHSS